MEGIEVRVPALDDIIRNRRARGRTRCLADAAALEAIKKSEPACARDKQ